MDVDLCHFVIGHTDFGSVALVVQPGRHTQTGSVAGTGNESEHGVQCPQRLASPVGADRTKEAMFHRIPFRRSGRIMADGDLQTVCICPTLQFPFLQATTIAIAAVRVGGEAISRLYSHVIDVIHSGRSPGWLEVSSELMTRIVQEIGRETCPIIPLEHVATISWRDMYVMYGHDTDANHRGWVDPRASR